MRYQDWRYLRSLGWSSGAAYRMLALLSFGVSGAEARRRAEAGR